MLRFTESQGLGSAVGGYSSRRDFLRVGSLGLGGLSLPGLLAAQEAGVMKDRSVVFLFMHGGPPQTETFDPKMDAPEGVRSAVGEVKTTIPGVTFGATLPRLAKLAHKMAVVRSYTTGSGAHDIKPIVSRDSLGANLGSLYARVAGATDPRTGLPRNVGLFPRAVVPEAQERVKNFGDFAATGSLGTAWRPFIPGAGGDLQRDMELNLSRERIDDRRGLLSQLDDLRRDFEGSEYAQGLSGFRAQAFDTILGGAVDAFDLSKEDPRTVARYDTEPLFPVSSIDKKWNNHKNYADHVRSLGKLMLMARRLCERGCGFVTVTTNFVWDFHSDKNNATVEEGMGYVAHPFDHAVSAFIEDVEARGLSEKILLVCCGEMGRTPKINARGGRDHWGKLAPLMVYGGGLKMGQVIGQSTRDAGEPASDPVTTPNLIATVLHSLLDLGKVRTMANLPAELGDVIGAKPIRGLV